MKLITINGQEFSLPEAWTEVDAKLLPQLLRLIYVLPANGSTYHELLRLLLGYSPKGWTKLMNHFFSPKRTEAQRDASAHALAELLRLVDWMWTGELTRRPMLYLRVGLDDQSWQLFDEGFKSMSFGELTDAYIHAQAFIKQLVPGDERLDLLVATICRPVRPIREAQDSQWDGDYREPYNEHRAAIRAKELRDRYAEEKVIILMYYLGTLKEFLGSFDIYDDGAVGPTPEEDYPGQNMLKNQHLLSEKHIFGGMKETKAANAHEVFQFLEEHSKDMRAEAERNRAANAAQNQN